MSINNNPIVLKASRNAGENCGLVRVTPEAESVIRRLRSKTGMPIRHIVSEIIVQAEPHIVIEED